MRAASWAAMAAGIRGDWQPIRGAGSPVIGREDPPDAGAYIATPSYLQLRSLVRNCRASAAFAV